jgi:amino acid permease
MTTIAHKTKWLYILILILPFTCFSQTEPDSVLTIYPGGNVRMNAGNSLKNVELIAMMKNCPKALSYMRIAKAKQEAETALIILGTATLLPALYIGIDMQLNNEYDNPSKTTLFYTLAGVGIGLDIIGLIIGSGYKKTKRKAVESFNNCLKNNQPVTSIRFKVGTSPNGVGLALLF